MSSHSNENIAMKWFDAFNAAKLEDLLALYDDHAQHYSPKLKIRQPETQGLITGKEALRNWWQDAFEKIPSLKYQPISFTANEDRVFMEYIRKVDNEPDIKVAEVLEIKNGWIVSSRVYHG